MYLNNNLKQILNMKILLLIPLLLITSFCSAQYSRKVDKFKDEVVCSFSTPNVFFSKYINASDTLYQTSFILYDSYLTVSGTDAYLLFADGTKLELKGEVDAGAASGSKYSYTFYAYGKDLVEKLSKLNLEAFKLHVFEKNISPANRTQIKSAANKMLVAK